MEFEYLGKYEAIYTPRDNEAFQLKDSARKYIGERLILQCTGPFDSEEQPRYAGETRFDNIDYSKPLEKDMPVWFSDRDLSDIAPVSPI